MFAPPATATDLYTQPTADLLALWVIDTMAVNGSWRNTSSDGGGGGGATAGGAAAARGAAAAGGGAVWCSASGAVGSGVPRPVAMSEKLADDKALVPAVPSGAALRSPGPATVIPMAA